RAIQLNSTGESSEKRDPCSLRNGLPVAADLNPLRGSSLDLTDQGPDISAGFLTASYDATTGIISSNGWSVAFNLGNNSTVAPYSIVAGQYHLSAQVSPTGQPISGSLNITGTIPGLASSGTLLTCQLSEFGFQT